MTIVSPNGLFGGAFVIKEAEEEYLVDHYPIGSQGQKSGVTQKLKRDHEGAVAFGGNMIWINFKEVGKLRISILHQSGDVPDFHLFLKQLGSGLRLNDLLKKSLFEPKKLPFWASVAV